MKFVQQPAVVDAWQVTDLIDRFIRSGVAGLPEPVADAYERGDLDFPTGFLGHTDPDRLDIISRHGIVGAPHGWWLVHGLQGEFYPVRPGAFTDTFAPITPIERKP